MKIPLWLKYGLITLIPLLIFLALISSSKILTAESPKLILYPFQIIFFICYFFIRFVYSIPLYLLKNFIPYSALIRDGEIPFPTPLGIAIDVLVWFIIGALMGYFGQKRKNKR